jgi:GTP-binding protein YchF
LARAGDSKAQRTIRTDCADPDQPGSATRSSPGSAKFAQPGRARSHAADSGCNLRSPIPATRGFPLTARAAVETVAFLMLKAGIVGLPNVGKSTLFNALTRSRKAEAANYPFCTIDPNVGVVVVPDERAFVLQKIAKTNVVIPAAIEFVDIAGLVAGASKGEGLGNQFLANIREVDAIVQVVRCFEDDDIVHTMGGVDPVRDIEVVTTELVLADLEAVTKRIDKTQKKAKSGDKEAQAELILLEKLGPHLNEGKTANTLAAAPEEVAMMKLFQLLTAKPVLFACNVAEGDLATAAQNPHVQKVAEFVRTHHDAAYVPISAKIESELVELPPEDAKAFLKDLGVDDSGVSALIKGAYALLGLMTYFTAGEKEVRAWTIKRGWKAPQAAGVIHTDFEKGFIKAEIVSYADLASLGSVAAAREAGKYRLEGKDYVFADGDVALFRFNN